MVVEFDSQIQQMESISRRIDYSLWTMLEIMTAIVCANLFPLTALWRNIKARLNTYKQKKSKLKISKDDIRPSHGSGSLSSPSSTAAHDSGVSKVFRHSIFRQYFRKSITSRYNPWVHSDSPYHSSSQMDVSKEKKGMDKLGENGMLSSPTVDSYDQYGRLRAGSYDIDVHKNFNLATSHPVPASKTVDMGRNTVTRSNHSYSAFPFTGSATTITNIGTAVTTPAAIRTESPTLLPIMGTDIWNSRIKQDFTLEMPGQSVRGNSNISNSNGYPSESDNIV